LLLYSRATENQYEPDLPTPSAVHKLHVCNTDIPTPSAVHNLSVILNIKLSVILNIKLYMLPSTNRRRRRLCKFRRTFREVLGNTGGARWSIAGWGGEGIGWDGTGRDGTGRDGMGRDGM